jgi:tetrahydromethanopterin S-methyltransferase subunit C
MAAKITTFILTFLLNVAIGVAIFFFLLLAMNGFTESDASYGLGTYIVSAFLVSLSMATIAVVIVGTMTKRQFRAVGAAAMAVFGFALLGGVLKIGCAVIGLFVAEFVRVNY